MNVEIGENELTTVIDIMGQENEVKYTFKVL